MSCLITAVSLSFGLHQFNTVLSQREAGALKSIQKRVSFLGEDATINRGKPVVLLACGMAAASAI